jgi:hypothetical protein
MVIALGELSSNEKHKCECFAIPRSLEIGESGNPAGACVMSWVSIAHIS